METVPRKWPLTLVCGLSVIGLYCCFTAASWALYPQTYGPFTHYLSRLGNFDYSPIGAYLYNWGCILTGVALVPFFLSLRTWYAENRAQIILLAAGQVLGVCSAIALIMIGVFSEDQGAPHRAASSAFFLLNFLVLILVNLALLWHPQFIKAIALYGISIDLLSLGLEFALGGSIVEWFTVFGALLFVGLLSFNTLRLNRSDSTPDFNYE
ncbi:MAG: DUF998 domain-containing protein [Candidatus Thorarchaeota archaeon]|nr:DUF998 domain-containing protein [Candidatus Thorarchaeota archaeon]